jgi:hypothetical protein
VSDVEEGPYPKSALEVWADRWMPRLIWSAVAVIFVLMLGPALFPPS